MAQFNAPQNNMPSMYGDLGEILGIGLGGLAGYGISQYKRPQLVEQLKQSGFSDSEANIVADMPPQQQAQAINQKMKQAAEGKKWSALGNILGGGSVTDQNQSMANESSSLDKNLGGLGSGSPMAQPNANKPTNDQKREAIMQSGLFDINEMEKIDKMLSREDEAKERKLERQENRTERQEKLQRKDIHETTKKWKEESKKADRDLHAFEEMSILRENPEEFTPTLLRKVLTKAGFGDFFKGKSEELYGKITEQLVFEKAAELASSGKMTAALMDRVRLRFPSLENTPEGAEVITNILGREAIEKKVHGNIYNELRKQGGWKKGSEPIDILEQVDEIAEPILEEMRKEANEALERDLNKKHMSSDQPDPSKVKRYRDTETGKIMVSNGREFVPEGM